MHTEQQGIVVAVSPGRPWPRGRGCSLRSRPPSPSASSRGPAMRRRRGRDRLRDADLPSRADLATRAPILALYGEAAGAPALEDVRCRTRPASTRACAASSSPAGSPPAARAGRRRRGPGRGGPGAGVDASRGPAPVHRVRAALPELGADEPLYALLSQRALAAVALVHFLRAVCAPRRLAPAARCARPSSSTTRTCAGAATASSTTGELLEHADAHGYHAAMAMIPLDAGRAAPRRRSRSSAAPRPALARLPRQRPHQAASCSAARRPTAALAMAAQALRRVERFERRSGLRVDRVMTPPHGMCSRGMTRALGAVGFDALVRDPPAAVDRARRRPTPLLAGWGPAEFVGGCAVIPRIPLDSTRRRHRAARLPRPPDRALRPPRGPRRRPRAAGATPPRASTASATCAGCRWRDRGHQLRAAPGGDGAVVRPFARRLRLAPSRARAPCACRRRPTRSTAARWRAGRSATGPVRPFGTDVPWQGNGHVEIRLRGAQDLDGERRAAPAWRPWPKLRRPATEARDRLLPLRP